jgi:hypothetical protein
MTSKEGTCHCGVPPRHPQGFISAKIMKKKKKNKTIKWLPLSRPMQVWQCAYIPGVVEYSQQKIKTKIKQK